jgi:hypothetical protein
MTAQRKDTIIINDDEHIMYGYPLQQYWENHNNRPSLFSWDTSLNRGYYAKWLIEQNKLYLIEFYGECLPKKEYSLLDLFPSTGDKVFAGWFCGDITIPMGKPVNYSHSFIGATFEYSTTIRIEKGIVVDSGSFLI